jgi:hypothetical protein
MFHRRRVKRLYYNAVNTDAKNVLYTKANKKEEKKE